MQRRITTSETLLSLNACTSYISQQEGNHRAFQGPQEFIEPLIGLFELIKSLTQSTGDDGKFLFHLVQQSEVSYSDQALWEMAQHQCKDDLWEHASENKRFWYNGADQLKGMLQALLPEGICKQGLVLWLFYAACCCCTLTSPLLFFIASSNRLLHSKRGFQGYLLDSVTRTSYR